MRRRTILFSAGCLLAAGLVMVVVNKPEPRLGFPSLAPGFYVGRLASETLASANPTAAFILDVSDSPEKIQIVFPATGNLQPLLLSGRHIENGNNYYDPIRFSVEDGQFELSGVLKERSVEGQLKNFSQGKKDNFTLTPIDNITEGQVDSFSKELDGLSQKLKTKRSKEEISGEIEKSREEKQKIESLFSGNEAIKARLAEKTKEATRTLAALSKEAAEIRKEVLELEGKVVLAQQLTPLGRLVSLSRESLEKDRAWFERMMLTAGSLESR